MPTGCSDVVAPAFPPLPPLHLNSLPETARGTEARVAMMRHNPCAEKKSSIGHQTLTRAHCWCSQKHPGPEKNRTGTPKTELAIFEHLCTLVFKLLNRSNFGAS